MDEFLELLDFLFHWRIAVSIAVSVVAAVVLSSLFAGFTAGYCIALVIFGSVLGLIWQGRGDRG